MRIKTCPKYKGCNAILCPLAAEDENNNYIWYPDEDICTKQEFSSLDWIKRQRKIARKAKEGYFTFAMLKRDFILKHGLQGLDPDSDISEKTQLQKWLELHPVKNPVKKGISEVQKEIGRQALKQYRENKKKEHAPA
jgi:hypothetical protein